MWEKIIGFVEKITKEVNDIVWGWPMISLILGTGLLITILLKVMQVRKFKESVNSTIVPALKDIGKKKEKTSKKENSISQFEAFSAATAGAYTVKVRVPSYGQYAF